jgi:hypothetical protein
MIAAFDTHNQPTVPVIHFATRISNAPDKPVEPDELLAVIASLTQQETPGDLQ